MKKIFSKLTAAFLAVLMLVSIVPAMSLTASAAVTGGKFENAQLDIVSNKESTLAPGVSENQYTVYDKNGDQVKMYVATADISLDSVNMFASYKDMDPTNFGISKLTEQVAAFNQKAAAGDEYYQGTVVAGINASYYNMTTGQPTGVFVMNGVVGTSAESAGYFAIMKDGTAKIGVKGDYASDKDNIQEAVGIYTMLIQDGKICAGLDAKTKYVRQTIGITADGKVITMTADGSQAPVSIGLTVQEQAEVMLDLGCVWAGHLDGGGSGTYGSKPEGSDKFVITNKPSDGSERSISNGLIIVSTATTSYEFDHIAFNASNEYMTPGTSVDVSVVGVSSTGNSSEIPENLTYEVVNGTYADGVFTAGNTVGDATITAMYNGKSVGTYSLNVVQPDAINFASETMTVPFGKKVDLNLSASLGAHNVAIKPSDIAFSMSNNTAGVVNGFTFIGAENPENNVTELTAVLAANADVTANTVITLGKGSVVLFDYEDGVVPDGWTMSSIWGASEDYGSRGELSIANKENGQVRNGNYSMAVDLEYDQSFSTGYHGHKIDISTLDLTFYKEDGVQGLGFWMYIPDGGESMYIRVLGWGKMESTGKTDRYNPTALATGQSYSYDGPGWHYLYVDLSGHNWNNYDLLNIRNIEFYMSDRDGADYGYLAKDHSSYYTKLTYYIDDITVDYSSAVDDREAPVISNPTYAVSGMSEAATLNGQTVTNNVVSFAANIKENTEKDNFTGLDESTAKILIDGIEVSSVFNNGIVSVSDYVLADGYHTVKFIAADNAGNEDYIIRGIYVDSKSGVDTVKLVPANPTADKLLWDSVYWMNLEATDLSKIDTVTTTLWLNGNNTWELDHMVLADGFEATYTVDANFYATITITRTCEVTASGAGVLASLPIRVFCYEYNSGNSDGAGTTNKDYPNGVETVPIDLEIKTYLGKIVFVDGTMGSFSAEKFNVDTEVYAPEGEHIANAKNWHYHYNWTSVTDKVLRDDKDEWFETQNKQATCTEDGYTGRIFCKECNSVVEWGTTIPATGHSYDFVDSVLKCENCGELFNGTWTDGKDYVDGICQADGWVDDYYYKDGVKLTGIQLIDGFYYNFGEDGVCASRIKYTGLFYDDEVSAWRYSKLGELAGGWVLIGDYWHYFDTETKVAVTGDYYYASRGITYHFDETGRTEGVWQITTNGTRFWFGQWYYQARNTNQRYFVEVDGKTYNFDTEGYVTPGVHALYDDWAAMMRGEMNVWRFDEKGALICQITEKGVIDGHDGVKYLVEEDGYVHGGNAGLASYDDAIYFVNHSGKLALDVNKEVTSDNSRDLLVAGTYYFGTDGKLFTGVKTGADGVLYYYNNGKLGNGIYNSELTEINGDIYLVKWSGKVAVNETRDVIAAKSNGFSSGLYVFDETGRGEYVPGFTGVKAGTDGILYYYKDGKLGSGIYNNELAEINGEIYLVKWSGKVAADEKRVIPADRTNGVLVAGTYYFGTDGKLFTGVKKEADGILYYYKDGKLGNGIYNSELAEINGEIYLVKWSGKVAANEERVIPANKANGLLEAGTYYFGEDGKLQA